MSDTSDKGKKPKSNKLTEVIQSNVLVLPTFYKESDIVLPGINKILPMPAEIWAILKKHSGSDDSNDFMTALNIAKIDDEYSDVGTICNLKKESGVSMNDNCFVVRTQALGVGEIQKIDINTRVAEIQLIKPFSFTTESWKLLINKKHIQCIPDKIIKEICEIVAKKRGFMDNSMEEAILSISDKKIITKTYNSFIVWIHNILNYLLDNATHKNLLKNIVDYLKLGNPHKHKEILVAAGDYFKKNSRWFFENTIPPERQMLFAAKIIIYELNLMKKYAQTAQAIAARRFQEDAFVDEVEMNVELIKRSIEDLKKLLQRKADSGAINNIVNYINKSLQEMKNEARQTTTGEQNLACEIEEYRRKLKSIRQYLPFPDDEKLIIDNINAIQYLNRSSSEYSVRATQLNFLFNLPWGKYTSDRENFKELSEILEAEHYGLQKPKERIGEYFAVRKLNPDKKGPILCFVGPPGVGKTSLGKSIARALGRKFIRVSLGGVKDEAEIKGHRSTYIGAKAGRILEGIRICGSSNPVFMIDEIDKLAQDYRGDPSSALLEVLDSEQNFSFQDHYLDVRFDLSQVMFIITANITDTIPTPLLDRMELIKIHGYSEYEKIEIAKKFLIPKSVKENGLKEETRDLFTSNLISKIIREYTWESGVRGLEKALQGIERKLVVKIVDGKDLPDKILPEQIVDYLGVAQYRESMIEITKPGNVLGLAYTSSGGTVLKVEALTTKKEDKITGNAGRQIRESFQAAVSLIQSDDYSKLLKTQKAINSHFHVHLPEGAVPKDGPSAGLAILMALISAVRKEKAAFVAMTGEITLLGEVLGIGGLKEKLLAAKRMGVPKVLIPEANIPELDETPEQIKSNLEIVPISKVEDALSHVFPALFSNQSSSILDIALRG